MYGRFYVLFVCDRKSFALAANAIWTTKMLALIFVEEKQKKTDQKSIGLVTIYLPLKNRICHSYGVRSIRVYHFQL